MSRLTARFGKLKKERKTGLIAYLTVGFPDVEATIALVKALEVAGTDIVELGVPFSDPLADGATIQRSSFHALQRGVTLAQCLDVCRRLRSNGVNLPLVLMGYYNPFLNLGLERFTKEAEAAGVDGVIVPDLPPEEAGLLQGASLKRGVDVIFMLAPTSTEERIRKVCAIATGFIYCVSLAGVTGARRELSAGLPDFLSRVRRHTKLPLAVGFGISARAHVEIVGKYAEAAVVGSALIDVIAKASPEERLVKVTDFIRGLRRS